tara:strand:+ start:44 stop:343 length:300 start_codon:yes stop_codon:yes gene_type:complete
MGIGKVLKLGIQSKGTGKAVGKGISVKDKMTVPGTPGFVAKSPKAQSLKNDPVGDAVEEGVQGIAFVGAPATAITMQLDKKKKKKKKPKTKIPGLKGKK